MPEEEKEAGETSEEKSEQVSAEAKEAEEKAAKEAEVKTKAESEEAKAAETKANEPKWWETGEYVSEGFKSEEDALKSVKEQRDWTVKVSQKNAEIIKEKADIAREKEAISRREETYRKYYAGELDDISDIERYIKEQEDNVQAEERKAKEKESIDRERVDAAIEVAKIRYPEVVKDTTLPELNALAALSKGNTPLERLTEAVAIWKRIRGLPSDVKEKVKDEQALMKEKAEIEAAASRRKETKKGAWDMSPDEFRKSRENVIYKSD